MRKLQLTLAVLVLCTSVSFADIVFNQTISNTYEYGVEVEYDQSLLVEGGGADLIFATDFSYVEIQNTAPLQENIGGIKALDIADNSILHFYDGEMGGFYIYGDASAVLEGGSISSIRSFQDVFIGDDVIKHIEIKCDTHIFDSSTNFLTGTWLDGSAFSINLIDQTGFDPVIGNIFFTPEPASLVLLGLGGLLLRRRSCHVGCKM